MHNRVRFLLVLDVIRLFVLWLMDTRFMTTAFHDHYKFVRR